MNTELELYKLITSPDEDSIDIKWVDDFGWIDDKFMIWVSKCYWHHFMTRLTQIFGYPLCPAVSGIDAKIYDETICFALSDMLSEDGINLEYVFPKNKYKH